MSEQTSKRTVEINGVKMEFDFREAQRINTFRVGDSVRVLSKGNSYGGTPKVYSGVITGFENFKSLPTIVVTYVDTDAFSDSPIKTAYVNEKSDESWEIIAYDGTLGDDLMPFTYDSVMARLTRECEDKLAAYHQACHNRDIFVRQFGHFFGQTMEGVIHTGSGSLADAFNE